ncbi:hypothetical protein TRIATDRAFT_308718 [Trichoderma atroviride IMI 206040]|uniref:Uncharacterized protein n=1 Tax=Hypocrea atroviridis (strain ATCC 20476 / IMI 206040) TaxID=452589 RepID=G9NW09_HYPAI|nr:uncharacterized protein TRIATDRAFT_308718 [Trichoderma atroviride IMI 206040]EHK45174.1 hypothetical protein TRIATDRAFT_308718 [Trichoderma atroviride IMI 206040]
MDQFRLTLGPQKDIEMMVVDSYKESGKETVWSRQETGGSDKELGDKMIWSRQETVDSKEELDDVSLEVLAQKSELSKKESRSKILNTPAASLERKEDVVKLEESGYEEAGSVHSDYGGNRKSRANRITGKVSIDATQEDAHESNREPIDIDPLDALVDGDCISLDDDEAKGDENFAIEHDNAMKNDNHSSKPSQDRPHTQTAEVDVAQWVKECNEAYRVDEDDKDARRCEGSFAQVIYAICNWATDIPDT